MEKPIFYIDSSYESDVKNKQNYINNKESSAGSFITEFNANIKDFVKIGANNSDTNIYKVLTYKASST